MSAIEVGKPLRAGDAGSHRDAVHVAVVAVTADYVLRPGERVEFSRPDSVEWVRPADDREAIGVVDPFLRDAVLPGERFFLFLFPNTITGLRHVWQHPAFTAQAVADRMRLARKAEEGGGG